MRSVPDAVNTVCIRMTHEVGVDNKRIIKAISGQNACLVICHYLILTDQGPYPINCNDSYC